MLIRYFDEFLDDSEGEGFTYYNTQQSYTALCNLPTWDTTPPFDALYITFDESGTPALSGTPVTVTKAAGLYGSNVSQAAANAAALAAAEAAAVAALTCVPANTPNTITGLVLWLKSDTGITKDGSDRVSLWADQSGAGNDASQGTGAFQPLYVASQCNGYPGIYFDGTRLLSHALNQAVPNSIFVVANLTDLTIPALGRDLVQIHHSGVTSCIGLAPNQGYWGMLNSSSVDGYDNALVQLNSTYRNNCVVFRTTTDRDLVTNGGVVNLTALNGTVNFGQNIGDVHIGNIVEIIVYNKAVSNSERQQIEYYLRQRYNLY